MSGLENRSQARPPTATTAPIASTTPSSAIPCSTRGLREIATARPLSAPSRRSSQRSAA